MKRWPYAAAATAAGLVAYRADALGGLPSAGLSAPVLGTALLAILLLAAATALAVRRAREARRESARLRALMSADATAHRLRQGAQRPEKAAPRRSRQFDPAVDTELTMLLRPVVAQSRNEAAGFDAMFPQGAGDDEDPANRDRARLAAAVEAMALRPNQLNRDCPVFLPVSSAFLADADSREFVAALVRGKANVARGLKLVVQADKRLAGAVAALPLDLALSGRGFSGRGFEGFVARASHFRIDARDLLSPHAARSLPAWQAVEWARGEGLAVVAEGIDAPEESARLVEMGIDLATGPGLAGPLRLRAVESSDEPVPSRRRRSRPRAGGATG